MVHEVIYDERNTQHLPCTGGKAFIKVAPSRRLIHHRLYQASCRSFEFEVVIPWRDSWSTKSEKRLCVQYRALAIALKGAQGY